jgi:mono/diheme cytochrome c family protein
MSTPFGVIYSTNITPDEKTGVGRWREADFLRAMRSGTAPGGRQLYPAFPYDHFGRATDADIADLYAFVSTLPPVSARTPADRLIPPLGFRPLIAIWKALFLHERPIEPVRSRGPVWNRGLYLTESLSHCGGCHRPRNALGAERPGPMSGGWVEGWYAPPLDASSPALAPWAGETAERIETYLRTGLDPAHAAAAGPMGPVTRELSQASPADVHAIAVYVASLMPDRPGSGAASDAEAGARASPRGATLYAGACASCHEPGAGMMQQGRPPLPLGTPLREASPHDVLAIIIEGLSPPIGRSGPYMPAFEASFTDDQLADLAGYLRARFTTLPPWKELKAEAAKARREARAEGR